MEIMLFFLISILHQGKKGHPGGKPPQNNDNLEEDTSSGEEEIVQGEGTAIPAIMVILAFCIECFCLYSYVNLGT